MQNKVLANAQSFFYAHAVCILKKIIYSDDGACYNSMFIVDIVYFY